MLPALMRNIAPAQGAAQLLDLGRGQLVLCAAFACASLGAVVATAAELPPSARAAMKAFRQERERVERAPRRASLERLFKLARDLDGPLALEDTIPVSWMHARKVSVLEAFSMNGFSDSEIEAVRRELHGVELYCGDPDAGVGAGPDAVFFDSLAAAKGRPIDVEMFRMYRRTYPQTIFWAAYIERTGHDTGCTIYGRGILVDLYGGWARFRSRHPRHSYAEVARWELERIEEALTQPHGSCGPAESVVTELEIFLRRYPRDRLAPAVRSRLHDLRSGGERAP